jgi:two-component system LytT family sensor kinase
MVDSVYHPFLEALYRNTNIQFWFLQIIGWFGLSLISFLSLTLWYNQPSPAYIAHTLLQSALGVLVSWPLRPLFHYFWNDKLLFRVSGALAGIIGCSLIWTILRISTFMSMTGEERVWSDFGGWLFSSILTFICWVAFYHGIKYYQLLQNKHQTLLRLTSDKQLEQLKRVRAESIAHEAQLKMLRYQLNPHFLFNTLNAISALVTVKEASKAHTMIVQLSKFLRYTLDNDPIQMVSLQEELEALKLYLNIEQTRFADRLRLEFHVAEGCDQVKVPSLILQPLVENSIKYAVAPAENGGKISVSAIFEGRFLIVEIVDTGPGIDESSNERLPVGIGLKNTEDRLNEFYNEDYELRLDNSPVGGLRVRIKLPADKID